MKDGVYGTENPNKNGGWDGMVGELVRRVSVHFVGGADAVSIFCFNTFLINC